MRIKSDENAGDIFDDLGNCKYPDVMIFSWKEISDFALEKLVESLEIHGLDLVEYEGTPDYIVRIVKKEDMSIKALFDELSKKTWCWSGGYSSHPNHAKIVGLGFSALPDLFAELKNSKNNPWMVFGLISEILKGQENRPKINPEDSGRLKPILNAYLSWWEENKGSFEILDES